ncbi:lysoplasmalogenase family protein, partial [Colwellia ponticola]
IWLYLRNPRANPVRTQKALAVVLLFGTPLISYLLSQDAMVALYGLSLGGMAACAWMSRFPRYRVGAGAVLFVVSDFLIFSRMGVVNLGDIPEYLIWPLYYAGQFLIATGVVQTLRGEHPGHEKAGAAA